MKEDRINLNNTRVIGENQLAFTNPTSNRPVLLTYGVSSCMVLILRNVETGEIGMIHCMQNDLEALEYFFKQMGANCSKLEGKIIGGKMSTDEERSRQHFEEINSFLRENHIKIAAPEVFEDQQWHTFGIDAQDGQFFYDQGHEKIVGDLIQKNIRNRKSPGDEGFSGYIGANKFICEFDGRTSDHQSGADTISPLQNFLPSLL